MNLYCHSTSESLIARMEVVFGDANGLNWCFDNIDRLTAGVTVGIDRN